MLVNGLFYNGRISKDFPATLEKVGQEFIIRIDSLEYRYSVGDCRIVAPVGKFPAKVLFADGGSFFIQDDWRVLAREMNWHPWIHLLENSWRWAGLATAGFLLILALCHFVVIPASSDFLAKIAPAEWVEQLSLSARDWLDESESAIVLEKAKEEKLEWAMAKLQQIAPTGKTIKVISSSTFGPNAFALPDGSIYITNELVDILTAEEIFAVLLHEMGHVKNRHGLALLIRGSFISVVFFTIFGADWMNLPVLLFSASYSREAEKESDLFAKTVLEEHGFSADLLASALNKISAHKPDSSKWMLFLESHPLTEERIRYLKTEK